MVDAQSVIVLTIVLFGALRLAVSWEWGGEPAEAQVVPQLACVIDGDSLTMTYPEMSGQWAESITYTRQ